MTQKKQPQPQNNQSEKTKELETKNAELTAGWQRTQADFVNFRKHVEEERSRLRKDAKVDFILRILPILDNFRLSTQHLPKELENHNWAKGVQHIERQIEQILADEGVLRIEALGQDFDPTLHEAIETVKSDGPENKVIEEIQTGYRIGDVCIRPSRVKVSKLS